MFELTDLRPSVRAQIKNSGVPTRFIGLELADLEPYEGSTATSVNKWLGRFIAGEILETPGSSLCGKGLLLVGHPGHGKTTLASVILQEVVRTTPAGFWGENSPSRPVLFVDYPKLLRIQQRSWKDDGEDEAALMEAIYGESSQKNNVRLLVLDDLGKEHRTASGWAENTFDAVLRSRYNAGLPTIVTTNVPLKNWGDVYGEPMESFAHEAFFPLSVVSSGGDRRK